MNNAQHKQTLRTRRHIRIRSRVTGSAECPRISIFRSTKHMNVQLIDDAAGRTIASASDKELKGTKKSTKTEQALAVGKLLAEKALALKVTRVVFDRGGYQYHGRVKAVADGAREGGLQF